MRYIQFNTDAEPDCLKSLRENSKFSFEDLRGECKEKVQNILKEQQNGFCAYCEQKFKSIVFIEHYKPQSKDSNKLDVLRFDNFLGVCSGKYYLNIQDKSKEYIPHCDTSKGDKTISIDPRNLEHINTLFYDEYNAIKSTNEKFDYDLNKTLNLNFPQLRDRRGKVFNKSLDNLIKAAKLKKLNKKSAYTIALASVQKGKYEFTGFLTFRYLKLLKSIENNNTSENI